MASKFLVLWHLDAGRFGPDLIAAVLRQQDHGRKLLEQGQLVARYHIVGGHGGAWIYQVESNEELDHLLAQAPVYNLATYQVIPLAEMTDQTIVGQG